MSTVLQGVRVKTDRAKAHLETIQAEVERVVGPNAYRTVVTQQDAERTQYVARIEGLQDLRPDFSAVVGDCLYNLRSALDHIAGGLIRRADLEPTRGTIFPVQPSEPENGLYIKPPPGPGADAMAVVESVQPYATGENHSHPLAFLDELNRIDKHRELLFAVTVLRSGAWGLGIDIPSPRVRLLPGEIKNGEPVAWFEFPQPWPAQPEPDFEPELILSIHIKRPTDFPAPHIELHRIDELIASMVWNVSNWIVPKFEGFF
jgi:hypothetical protein